jgi:hypothetical protein
MVRRKTSKTLKTLKTRAKKLGFSLWEHGGYYYMSGRVKGKHAQGIFSNLRNVSAELAAQRRKR